MAGALSSLKIVEIGEMASAPYASKLMADMGAEVIKVERPGVGDHARVRGPFPGGQPHPEKSGLFLYLNTNKLGVTLDIARPEGFEILEKLVAQADVLIHNVPPLEMDRVGLHHVKLIEQHRREVRVSRVAKIEAVELDDAENQFAEQGRYADDAGFVGQRAAQARQEVQRSQRHCARHLDRMARAGGNPDAPIGRHHPRRFGRPHRHHAA